MGWPSLKEDIDACRDDLQHLLSALSSENVGQRLLDVRAAQSTCERLLLRIDAVVDLATDPAADAALRTTQAEAKVSRLEAQLGELQRAKDVIHQRLAHVQEEFEKQQKLWNEERESFRSRLRRQENSAAAKVTKANAEAADARRVRKLLSKPVRPVAHRRKSGKAPRQK